MRPAMAVSAVITSTLPSTTASSCQERRNGHRIVVERLGQCDSSRKAEDGAGERGERLCRGQSCADLIDIEIPSSSDNEPAVA
jgi:hypothetical protein